jgi:hypothetical protein
MRVRWDRCHSLMVFKSSGTGSVTIRSFRLLLVCFASWRLLGRDSHRFKQFVVRLNVPKL